MSLYWQEQHYQALKSARSYNDLSAIALDILGAMPQPVGEVCGPISSGGRSIEENLAVFSKVNDKLTREGKYIVDLVPFEIAMRAMKRESGLSHIEANLALLEGFYLPIFKSGKVSELYFIPGWQASHGASWERDRALEFNIKIIDLSEEWMREIWKK